MNEPTVELEVSREVMSSLVTMGVFERNVDEPKGMGQVFGIEAFMNMKEDPKFMTFALQGIISKTYKMGLERGKSLATPKQDMATKTEEEYLQTISKLQEMYQEALKEIAQLKDAKEYLKDALALGKDINLNEGTPEAELLKKAYQALDEAKMAQALEDSWGYF
ncbi:hypothetical protein EH802P2_00074 [Enterococcus phage EH802P2]|nr:hypothetical protein EH802P1_00025 [Enterococcus phage EH802P1]WAX16179.1 hypothetical protein EH802P2_00074 [Enterococcus phage EH802P2]